ncbi:MAG: radical SAM protein [Thermodesulfobacteriota bacterium]|nr:radical SAM protein [Thermodesulfobacteriota bacterium]
MSLMVNEIFYSIQGESTYSGCPCIFIRLTGCNLRCSYCDTTYAYTEGKRIEVADILKHISSFRCNLVEITGGEPLLQDNTTLLIENLIQKGYSVLIETNGSLDISPLHDEVIKIMDIKTPSSGMEHCNLWDNIDKLTDNDQVKFVIGEREDYMWALSILNTYHRLNEMEVLFSPVFNQLSPQVLADWILKDRLKIRLQLQLHNYIWENKKRGV